MVLLGLSTGLAIGATIDHAWIVAGSLGFAAAYLTVSGLRESALARVTLLRALHHVRNEVEAATCDGVVERVGAPARADLAG
jgi:hypothetical protein